MRTRGVVLYAAVGCVLGGLAGVAAAGALCVFPTSRDRALFLAALAGGLVALAGAISTRSQRAALYECAAGVLMGVAALGIALNFLESAGKAALPAGLPAVVSVLYTLGFSAVLGVLHTWRYGKAVAAPAALFAGIGGLTALFLATTIVSVESAYATAGASGAIFGALVWAGVGLARRLFGVDVEVFRVL